LSLITKNTHMDNVPLHKKSSKSKVKERIQPNQGEDKRHGDVSLVPSKGKSVYVEDVWCHEGHQLPQRCHLLLKTFTRLEKAPQRDWRLPNSPSKPHGVLFNKDPTRGGLGLQVSPRNTWGIRNFLGKCVDQHSSFDPKVLGDSIG
jgi:hypothetical protein